MKFFHYAVYLVFRAGEALVRLFPISTAFVLGRAGGAVAYHLARKRRALAFANLQVALGSTLSETELHLLNREHFQLLGANLFAGIKSSTMPHHKIWERLAADIPEERVQPGWIALISHIGNWELFSHLGEMFPAYRFGAVYQKLANPFIDRHLREVRLRSGITLFDRRTEMLKCVRFLRDGGAVGVLVDQSAGYAGLWTPLFGRLTSSSTLAATLAIRTGAPVVPLAINTCGRARWRLTIGEPHLPGDEDAEQLTARINRLLEEQIRRAPADWLWAHNRWKPLRPHILFARDQRRVFLPPGTEPHQLDPFRILIIADEPVTTAAAVRVIKDGRPDTRLVVLTSAAHAQTWRENSDIAQVITTGSGSPFALARELRRTTRFDAAVFFSHHWRAALAARLAGIPVRAGWRPGLVSRLYNHHPHEPREPVDAARLHLLLAHSLGAAIPDPPA